MSSKKQDELVDLVIVLHVVHGRQAKHRVFSGV